MVFLNVYVMYHPLEECWVLVERGNFEPLRFLDADNPFNRLEAEEEAGQLMVMALKDAISQVGE